MVKHRRSTRKRTRLIKGNIDESNALATLANNTLTSSVFGDVVQERTFAISMEATWLLRDQTALEGGVLVGVAHSNYTDAEIEAYIENTGSWDEGDLSNQEIAKRKIRIIGTFGALGQDVALNEGQPIKTKLGFVLNQGATLTSWAYNRTGAALTTGSFVLTSGWIWLRPM